MTARRIIPCLDVKDGRVVKGVKFVGHTDMGDAAELAARYRDEGADELVFYDITASPEGRTLDYAWVKSIARLLDIPFCVAGGIRTVDQAAACLDILGDMLEPGVVVGPGPAHRLRQGFAAGSGAAFSAGLSSAP